MSASAEIIIEREPNMLLIPLRASFRKDGKPAVYVQIGQEFRARARSRWGGATTTTSSCWAG